jgi:hypothetical protein
MLYLYLMCTLVVSSQEHCTHNKQTDRQTNGLSERHSNKITSELNELFCLSRSGKKQCKPSYFRFVSLLQKRMSSEYCLCIMISKMYVSMYESKHPHSYAVGFIHDICLGHSVGPTMNCGRHGQTSSLTLTMRFPSGRHIAPRGTADQ